MWAGVMEKVSRGLSGLFGRWKCPFGKHWWSRDSRSVTTGRDPSRQQEVLAPFSKTCSVSAEDSLASRKRSLVHD